MTGEATPSPAREQPVRIAARPGAVWALWTEPPRLAVVGAAEVAAEPGGLLRVVMERGRWCGEASPISTRLMPASYRVGERLGRAIGEGADAGGR
ncbi:MAG: hypothetical protein NVSMB32_17190 [Actinomycetota bacterium]